MRISSWRLRGVLGALSLLVVGALIGLVGHHFVLGDEGPQPVADADAHRAAIPVFAQALGLDDDQVTSVEAILSRHQTVVTEAWAALHARLQTSADSAHGEIEALLSAEQRDKFAEWMGRQHPSSMPR
jgi:hypothetical protein